MKGSIGVSTRLEYLFFGTAIYNKAYMKHIISSLNFSKSKQAAFRLKVIEFHNQYGTKATIDAYGIPRRTIFYWKRLLKDGQGKLESLIPKKKTPKNKRQMTTDYQIISFLKQQREEREYIGKEKLKKDVDEFCVRNNLKTISVSTIGKIIKRYCSKKPKRIYHNPSHQHKNLYNRYKTKVKRSPKISFPGYIEIDTIVKFVFGVKLYILNAVDVYTKFSFSYGYNRLSSKNSLDFLKRLLLVYPIKEGIHTIQTDNGLEFLADFDSYLKQKGIKHVFIYPRCPKINAYVERANRSLQEEFVNDNEYLVLEDGIDEFNSRLIEYLIWYNTKRPHYSLNYQSPIDFMLNYLKTNHQKINPNYTLEECKMYGIYTYCTNFA